MSEERPDVYYMWTRIPGERPFMQSMFAGTVPERVENGVKFPAKIVYMQPNQGGVFHIPANDPFYDMKVTFVEKVKKPKCNPPGKPPRLVGPAHSLGDIQRMMFEQRPKTADEQVMIMKATNRELERQIAALRAGQPLEEPPGAPMSERVNMSAIEPEEELERGGSGDPEAAVGKDDERPLDL